MDPGLWERAAEEFLHMTNWNTSWCRTGTRPRKQSMNHQQHDELWRGRATFLVEGSPAVAGGRGSCEGD